MMNILILQSLILATNAFNTKVAQANLLTKTDLMLNCQVLTEIFLKTKQII